MKLLIPFCGEWFGWRAFVAMTRDVAFVLGSIALLTAAWVEWIPLLK